MSKSGRLVALDAWRGVLALLVVFYHFIMSFFVTDFDVVTWWHGAYLIVDAFFVLSGFIMVYIYGNRIHDERSFKAFMIRRFFRLWPLNALVLLAFIALQFMQGVISPEKLNFSGAYSFSGWISSILFVQAFNIYDLVVWNVPAWSVSVEFYVYMVFGISMILLGSGRVFYVSICLIAVSMAFLAYGGKGMKVEFDYGFWRCMYGFFVGVLAANFVYFHRKNEWVYRNIDLLQWMCVPGFYAYILMGDFDYLGFLSPFVFSLIVIVFSHDSGSFAKILHARVFGFFAKTSYSIYMNHFLILILVSQAAQRIPLFGRQLERDPLSGRLILHGYWEPFVLCAISYLFIIIASWVTYRYIELRFQRYGERFFPSRLGK